MTERIRITKKLTVIIAAVIVIAVAVVACGVYFSKHKGAAVRGVTLSEKQVDISALIEGLGLDDAVLNVYDGGLSFTAGKTEERESGVTSFKYDVVYDEETNKIIATATIYKPDGTAESDSVEGVAFWNEDGELDAVMILEDGEFMLLSEMRDAGLIANTRLPKWLSWVIIAVVAVVVVVVAIVVPPALAYVGPAAMALVGGPAYDLMAGQAEEQEKAIDEEDFGAPTYDKTDKDGVRTRKYPNGTIRKDYPDGHTERTFPSGETKIDYPDGTIKRKSPDGTTSTYYPSGETHILYPNGHFKHTWPDGAIFWGVFHESISSISFSMQGGVGACDPVEAVWCELAPTVAVPQREGYVFLGYFDKAVGGIQYYNSDGTSAKTYDKTADITLFAQWAKL